MSLKSNVVNRVFKSVSSRVFQRNRALLLFCGLTVFSACGSVIESGEAPFSNREAEPASRLGSQSVSDSKLHKRELSQRQGSVSERTRCFVLRVYDGDTLACDLNDNGRVERPEENIRLLGIDTPETRHSKRYRGNSKKAGHDQPFAQQAKRFLKSRTLKQTVYLEWDREKHDRFGRALAFVYQSPDDEISLNERLLTEGYATLMFIAPNRKHRRQMEAAEAQARHGRRGLWDPAVR